MSYLLDTHILLWWLADNPKLTEETRQLIKNPKNTFFVSSASAWEIAIKKALGKLEAPDDLETALAANNFIPLNISIAHALSVGKLPQHHLDPFDRMLIAQAKLENITIITHDIIFKKYSTSTAII